MVQNSIPPFLVKCPQSLVVTLSLIYCINRQMRWGRLPNESSMLTTLPLKFVTMLKLPYLLRRASFLASTMMLPCWTSGGASLLSSAYFLFFDGSSTGCFPLSFGGGGGERWGDYGEKQAGTSSVLGVESVIRGAVGVIDLGVAWDHASHDDPTVFFMDSSIPAKRPIFAEIRKIWWENEIKKKK